MKKVILIWLICGIILVYFQIIIGGITRLTGSGLSITDWEIVTGTFPPLTESAWQVEFQKYQETPQYQKINQGMDLGSIWSSGTFKFIYFWEYFHRLWARSMGFIFLFPFIFFYFKKWMPLSLRKDLGVVVGLAGLAAIFGWIMVASGLVNRPWVNAYKLSIHLCIGFSVFGYLFWTTIKYYYRDRSISRSGDWSLGWIRILFGAILLQLFLGGLMSGMKAALFYPTWPDIGGYVVPPDLFDLSQWTTQAFIDYDKGTLVFGLVQFLHRSVAYIICGLVAYIGIRQASWTRRDIMGQSFNLLIGLILLQVFIGILTLIKSIGMVPVFLGVLHQAVAVIVLGGFLLHYFYLTRSLKHL